MNTPNKVVPTGATLAWIFVNGVFFLSKSVPFFLTFIKRKINGHVNGLLHFEKDAPSLITIGLGQLRGLVQDVLSRLSHDQAHVRKGLCPRNVCVDGSVGFFYTHVSQTIT